MMFDFLKQPRTPSRERLQQLANGAYTYLVSVYQATPPQPKTATRAELWAAIQWEWAAASKLDVPN